MLKFSRTLAVLCLPLALVATACGSDSKSDSKGAPDVSGKTYTVASTTDYTMVPDSKIELAFGADGTLAVSAGCNNMSSTYTIEGDVLKVPVFATTLKACEDPLMAQDKWVSDLLTSNPTIAAAGTDGIVITGKSGSMTLQIK